MKNQHELIWEGEWIGPSEVTERHPILEKNITLQQKAETAVLYICGLGLFEAYINEKKIGNDYLAPLFSDYNSRLQVSQYDVTSLLENGDNTIEFWLGNGWYKGRFGLDRKDNNYGERFAVIAVLEITFGDGTRKTICTDASWHCRLGPVLDSGIYDGEIQDYTLLNVPMPVEQIDIDKGRLYPRTSLPVIIHERLPVKEILYTLAGEVVLDFGQNFAGWVEFRSNQPEHTTISLDFGEVLQEGNFFNTNYQTAKAKFVYTCDGESRLVRPHFTYYGFRYVRVSGWEGELRPDDFEGCVLYSDIQRTGWFSCGNDKINRLYENALWSQKSNFIDLPTDCPQRDERLGWTGDAQVFSKTACINMDCKAFFDKYLCDLREEQLKFDGAVPNYVPNIGSLGGTSSVWGDAATIIPMNLYEVYGDVDMLAKHYPLMKDWVDWVAKQDEARGARYLFDFGFHFGDWLAQDGVTEDSMKGGTDDSFIASVYYCNSARLVAKAAEIISNKEDALKYQNLAKEIEKAIYKEYFTASGRLAIDTQAAYIICLHFGIYIDKSVVLRDIKRRFEKDNWKIKCGFVGAPLLCQTLAENGMQDIAMHFLMNEGFPGWLYCVNLGATTIWERWNSLLPDGTCNGTNMNSFNHYTYGSVAEYLYKIAGLNVSEAGWSAARLEPLPDIRLGSAKAVYDSVNGLWESEWRINEDGTLTIRFVVPEGCKAEAILPYSQNIVSLSGGVYEETYVPGRDLRQPYTMDMLLMDMLQDGRVVEILKETLPQITHLLDAPETGNWTLASMQHMGYLHLTPENVQSAAEQITQLLYQS